MLALTVMFLAMFNIVFITIAACERLKNGRVWDAWASDSSLIIQATITAASFTLAILEFKG